MYQRNRCIELTCLMFNRLRLDERLAKVIHHHPLGSMFGWITTDYGESIPIDFGDARRDAPAPHMLAILDRDFVGRLRRIRVIERDSQQSG